MASIFEVGAFVERGLKVFPVFQMRDGACICGRADCNAPGKHPRTYNGVLGASDNPSIVSRWFVNYPGANWAVATGQASGVWVLDVDQHGLDGVASMRDWLESNGVTMPETYTVRTGGGGWHFYFRADEPMSSPIGVLPGVDVRADGAYVLLPGSNHLSGGVYEVVNDVPIVSAPRRLLEFLKSAKGTGSGGGGGGGARTKLRGLDYYLEHGFTPGARDVECYTLACSLWGENLDNPHFVEVAIADCWRATEQGDSPFPWSQARRKIGDARRFIESSRETEARAARLFGGVA